MVVQQSKLGVSKVNRSIHQTHDMVPLASVSCYEDVCALAQKQATQLCPSLHHGNHCGCCCAYKIKKRHISLEHILCYVMVASLEEHPEYFSALMKVSSSRFDIKIYHMENIKWLCTEFLIQQWILFHYEWIVQNLNVYVINRWFVSV